MINRLLALIVCCLVSTAATACPAGSTCVTYLAFSGESILAPSGDTTGATDVAAINAAIVQNKPDKTQSVVRLGTGTFYINSTQILDWPYTTIEGHYMSSADGGSGTPGGTILKAAGSWSATVTPTTPAIMSTADRDTLRNLTFVGLGGTTPDCVKIIDTEGNDLDKVDVVGCHIGYNNLADSTLATCGGPVNYYPHQNCVSQLTHWFLGNAVANTSYGVALGGIGGSDPAFASDTFLTGTNFYGNGVGASSPFTCGGAQGISLNFGEYAGNAGGGIFNSCNAWTVAGNQISASPPPLLYSSANGYFNVVAGNQLGNTTGPLVRFVSNFYPGAMQSAGNLYYQGCVFQVEQPMAGKGIAFYEMPNAAFGCSGSDTTNLDSVIIVPGSAFP